jgi:acyl-CoA thioesterase YciA
MDHLGTFPIKTADLGLHGNLFGGTILFWTDACAVSYVMKMTRQPRLVTKTMNSIFVSPVKAGELLSHYGWPIQIGRTSIQVVVEAKTLNMESTEERLVFTASIVFVCISEQGKPMQIGEADRDRINCSLLSSGRDGLASTIDRDSVSGPKPPPQVMHHRHPHPKEP